jgi:hypothetical protein
MKVEFFRQIFEKYLDFKFYENLSSGSRVVPCGETGRHDEANSRFLKFLKFEILQMEEKCGKN